MKKPSIVFAVATAAVAAAAGGLAQVPEFSSVQIVPVKVASNLYMLQGAGGNLALSIGDDAVFLVDDQYAPLATKIKASIATLTPKPVKFVVNTHWHGDHTGGNENFGASGAVIVAHDNVRRRMSTEQFNEFFDAKTPPSSRDALPVVTFAESVRFHVNGEEIHVFHVPPSHTDGDSVIHFVKANAIHTGDIFFNGLYPFIDVSSGGGIDGMIAVTDTLLAMVKDDTKIIPGHGPLAGRADLQAYRDMLVAVRTSVRALVDAGKTRAEAIAAKPTAAYDAKWGGGFFKPDQFTAIVYEDVARSRKKQDR